MVSLDMVGDFSGCFEIIREFYMFETSFGRYRNISGCSLKSTFQFVALSAQEIESQRIEYHVSGIKADRIVKISFNWLLMKDSISFDEYLVAL